MSLIQKMFPAPAALELPVFGLDISDNSFKYLKLKKAHGSFRIQTFGEHAVPPGIIESGTIKQLNEFAYILKEELQGKKLKYVNLSLPEEKGFLRIIRLPAMSAEELAEAIPLQLEENVPLSADEAAYNYQILPSTNPSASYQDILLLAFPKLIIDSYLEATTLAGLIPVSMEMEAQAMARTIIPKSELGKTILVADVGLTRTGFFIVDNGMVKFTSTVPIGGKNINKAISEAFGVNIEEAEKIKIRHGLSQSPEGKKTALALASIVNTLKEEAARRIDFWQLHAPGATEAHPSPVEKMYLCGGDANLAGLPSYLTYELKIPVELANVWTNIIDHTKYIPEIEFNKSLGYTTTLGLAFSPFSKTSL